MELCLTLVLSPSRGNLNALCKGIIKPALSYTFWECPFFLDWIIYKLHVCAWVQSSLHGRLTNTIDLLFIWPSANIVPEQNRTPNLSSGLCWALPDSVSMLGKKWPLGVTHTVKWRGTAALPPRPPQMLQHPLSYSLWLQMVIGWDVTPQGEQRKRFLEWPGNRAPSTQARHWQMRKL